VLVVHIISHYQSIRQPGQVRVVWSFFSANSAQQHIFQLMSQIYGMAKLTENPDLLDLAIWLAQSDNLHLIQWFGRGGPEAEVSSYFTPDEWWPLGRTASSMSSSRSISMHSMPWNHTYLLD